MASLKETLKEKLLTAVKDHLKADEREFVNPWSDKDKASVLQDSRCFSETPLDPTKCTSLLTRIVYLLQQGEQFTAKELTALFFSVTKLFHSQNTKLRRMVYLIIKELDPADEEVFIVISCLIQGMNSKNDCFRANSIRVLAKILDPAMAAQIDRYLKTAIVDKNPFVASSALVCGIGLTRTMPEVVKRWVNEIQETVNSQHTMVQFHALALIYELKKTDRLALHKVVTGLAKSSGKSAMAECLVVRYACQVLMTDRELRDQQVERTMLQYLDSCLRNKSETVQYEAARSFCHLAMIDQSAGAASTSVLGYDISHAITILQIFLTSPKAVVRFGAIRTLNALAQHRPQVAARCNSDMEPLLSDQNRNIATLALTTLLKTGHESNVEKLVKQITSFMSDISDAFKIEVVRAVKGLCLLYPGKYKVLMNFLSTNLREDGTSDFKRDLVDALIIIIAKVPQARETGLSHLCEFIEDCEYAKLCTRILGLLGEEVPKTSQPSKYIRFIYNRLILEDALVRAAAVDALTKIAVKCPDLRRDVLVLLQFGQNDNDDEVRDRISLYSSVLRQSVDQGKDDANSMMDTELSFSVDALYDGLLSHMSSDLKDAAFSVDGLPSDADYKAAAPEPEKKPKGPAALGGAAAAAVAAAKEPEKPVAEELMKALGEIASSGELGSLQHSCRPKALTESEAEYTVQVIKHMFPKHIVLEMCVSNTVPGVTLENVEVKLSGLTTFVETAASTIPQLVPEQKASAYCVLEKSAMDDAGVCLGRVGVALHFICKEEGDDVGFPDDYPVEDFSITTGDFLNPKTLPAGQFKTYWETLQAQGAEDQQKMQLGQYKTLEAAAEGIIQILNMSACDNTAKPEPGSRGHTLNLSGTFLGGNLCLVRGLVGMDPQHGCVAKIHCRSKSQACALAVAKALFK